jgi:uroporphyrinogen-III decarboxylase
MGEIIQFNQHRAESKTLTNDVIVLSKKDVHKVEQIRDSIETALEKVATSENMPLTVAMAAGRYAAMRMFQLQGRAETMSFMDQCITTAELCDDLMQHLDEDA